MYAFTGSGFTVQPATSPSALSSGPKGSAESGGPARSCLNIDLCFNHALNSPNNLFFPYILKLAWQAGFR